MDLEHQTIVINGSNMKSGYHLGVPVSDEALSILRRQRGRHETYVFTRKGKQIKSIDNGTWKSACLRADVQDVVFHTARHTWSTRMMRAGCSIERLKVLGGWSDINVPMKKYIHLQVSDLRADANLISKPLVKEAK